TIGLDERAARAQVHYVNETARTEGGASDVFRRTVVTRISASILHGLTHDRDPGSYFKTRVRPVAPSTRTAYCALPPRMYNVPDVAVPSGLIVKMRAAPMR